MNADNVKTRKQKVRDNRRHRQAEPQRTKPGPPQDKTGQTGGRTGDTDRRREREREIVDVFIANNSSRMLCETRQPLSEEKMPTPE